MQQAFDFPVTPKYTFENFVVCSGNKTAYQSHGIWFAKHGYICLVLDTLEMGEMTCTHHGTYRDERWWWLSRGYTPAAVECWNGVRGIDYLISRPDVDPRRIGMTGDSCGGWTTLYTAALDPRITAAAPASTNYTFCGWLLRASNAVVSDPPFR